MSQGWLLACRSSSSSSSSSCSPSPSSLLPLFALLLFLFVLQGQIVSPDLQAHMMDFSSMIAMLVNPEHDVVRELSVKISRAVQDEYSRWDYDLHDDGLKSMVFLAKLRIYRISRASDLRPCYACTARVALKQAFEVGPMATVWDPSIRQVLKLDYKDLDFLLFWLSQCPPDELVSPML